MADEQPLTREDVVSIIQETVPPLVHTEVRRAVSDAMTDVPSRAEVERRLDQQNSHVGQQIDSVDVHLRRVEQLFQAAVNGINDLKLGINDLTNKSGQRDNTLSEIREDLGRLQNLPERVISLEAEAKEMDLTVHGDPRRPVARPGFAQILVDHRNEQRALIGEVKSAVAQLVVRVDQMETTFNRWKQIEQAAVSAVSAAFRTTRGKVVLMALGGIFATYVGPDFFQRVLDILAPLFP